MAGAADNYTPAALARMIAAEISGSRVAISAEAGHSVYWEQPQFFNQTILDFIGSVSR